MRHHSGVRLNIMRRAGAVCFRARCFGCAAVQLDSLKGEVEKARRHPRFVNSSPGTPELPQLMCETQQQRAVLSNFGFRSIYPGLLDKVQVTKFSCPPCAPRSFLCRGSIDPLVHKLLHKAAVPGDHTNAPHHPAHDACLRRRRHPRPCRPARRVPPGKLQERNLDV